MAQAALVTIEDLISGLRKMEKEVISDILEEMGALLNSSPFLNGKEPQSEVEVWEARWQLLEVCLQQRLKDDKIEPLLRIAIVG